VSTSEFAVVLPTGNYRGGGGCVGAVGIRPGASDVAKGTPLVKVSRTDDADGDGDGWIALIGAVHEVPQLMNEHFWGHGWMDGWMGG